MKITSQQASSFLAHPPEEVRIFLIYGPDAGLVHARVRQLIATLQRPVRSLVGEKLSAALLMEIALNHDLFGNAPSLIVESADDSLLPALKTLMMHHGHAFHPIILVASEPPPTPNLRTFCQNHAQAAAVGCYTQASDSAQLRALVLQKLRHLSISEEGIAYLVHYGQGYQHLLKQEIEKILLYKHGQTSPLSLQEIKSLCGHEKDNFYDVFDSLLQALVQGRVGPIREAFRACKDHSAALPPMLAYHFQRLWIVHAFMAESKSYAQALEYLKPPVHFSQKDFFAQQLKRWDAAQIQNILHALFETECRMRQGTFVQLEKVMLECTCVR